MAINAPATADPPPSQADDGLILRLVEEFKLSVAEQLRLHALIGNLSLHGVRPDDATFGNWLSPVFCGSGAEQAAFLARFAELRKEMPRPPRRRVTSGAGTDSPAPVAAPPTRVPQSRSAPSGGRARLRRVGIAAGLILALPLAAWAMVFYLMQKTRAPEATVGGGGAAIGMDIVTAASERFASGWGLGSDLGAYAALGLIPLVLGLLLSYLLLLRLKREQRSFRPTPERSRPIALHAALRSFFGDEEVLRSLIGLTRHRVSVGSRLNVRRSLRATLRNGGFPALRFGARPTIPAYLMLVDRESPRDHLPLVAEMLSRRLRQQHAAVSRYGFNRRPTFLVNLDENVDPIDRLEQLTDDLPEARILVLAETDRLVQSDGRPAEWLQAIAAARQVAVLAPRDESDWAEDERTLRRAGCTLVPATADGARRYADWVAAGGGRLEAAHLRPPRLDLPFQLSRHRAMLTSDLPLESHLVEGLLQDLSSWLGGGSMRLLRALAVFPRLEPPLTLAIGRALAAPDGEPLLTDATLLPLVRLPWFRAGRIPDHLRARLVRELASEDLRTAVTLVHAYLVSEADALRLLTNRPPRRPDLLAHWLRQAEDSDLHDRILIDAVEGRPPEALGSEMRLDLRTRIRRAVGKPASRAAVAACGVAAVAMWLQPKYDDRPVSSPTTVPVSPTPAPTPTLSVTSTSTTSLSIEPERPSATAQTSNRKDALPQPSARPSKGPQGASGPVASAPGGSYVVPFPSEPQPDGLDRLPSNGAVTDDPMRYKDARNRIERLARLTNTRVPISISVPPGEWIRIDLVRSYNPETCAGFVPTVSNLIDPLEGRVQFREAKDTFKTKDCGEINGPAYEVYYRADDAFEGPDILSYVLRELEQTTVVEIEVETSGP